MMFIRLVADFRVCHHQNKSGYLWMSGIIGQDTDGATVGEQTEAAMQSLKCEFFYTILQAIPFRTVIREVELCSTEQICLGLKAL